MSLGYKKVGVIATFNPEGQIRPLWVRVPLGEELTTVEVLATVETPQELRFPHMVDFKCRIRTGENTMRDVQLRFNKRDTYWELSYDMSM